MEDIYKPERRIVYIIVTASVFIYGLGTFVFKLEPITLSISTIALLLGMSSLIFPSVTIKQARRNERIRQIEKSLESFYIPLQRQIIEYNDNTINTNQKINEVFKEVVRYQYLAELNTLSYLNSNTQTNKNLRELQLKVESDIQTLQDEYNKLKQI